MNIRNATEEDLSELFALSCRLHRLPPYDSLIPEEYRARLLQAYTPGSRFETLFRMKFLKFIRTPEHYSYVAEVDGRAVGYRLAERKANHIYMHGLFVDPDYQGQGIGRALFTLPLSLARPGDVYHLTVLSGNERAKRLYESQGFQFVRESASTFYGAPQDEMELKVPSSNIDKDEQI